jgi:cysteine desulfurase / selenocysteine lyase
MSLIPSELRKLFPAVSRRAYLNAAASSPLATPVAEAIEAQVLDTMENGDVHFMEWLGFRDRLRERVGRFVGGTGSEIAFLGSTSMGFSVVGSVWKQRGIRKVLTLEGEFPSTTIPLLNAGLELEVVRASADGSTSVERLFSALTTEVGAVAVSAVQFASGFRIDLDEVARECRERRLPLAVNAAQALGQVPVDVAALGCEFLAAPSHKWMLGGFGVGVFYARSGSLAGVRLPVSGWFTPPESMRWDAFAGAARVETSVGFSASGVAVREEACALEAGGPAWAAMRGFAAGLELIESVGVELVLAHNQRLQKLLRAGLRSRGFVPRAPDDEAGLAGICVVPVSGEVLGVVRGLFKEGIVSSPRGGGVRLSTHVFNDESDVEKALSAFDAAGVRPA